MIAFDDNQNPVLATPFTYPQDTPDTSEADLRLVRQETIYRMLEFLTYKATGKKVARRALFLAALCNLPKRTSQRQLAKAMGLTEGRVSQALASARVTLKHLEQDWRDLPQPETKVSGILAP
jgi:DNA-directed RNA polymerase specialized sigma24 family protein